VQKGSKLYTMRMRHDDKTLYLKDSLCLLQMPLRAFPSAFGFENTAKEVFPYNYYNKSRGVGRPMGVISAGGHDEVPRWDNATKLQFVQNVNSIDGCKTGNDSFDMLLYARYYCSIDVDILRRGFNKFRQDCMVALQLDPADYTTLPSLAHAAMSRNVYAKVDDLYEVGGKVAEFCRGAVYGGRCMTRDNTPHRTTIPLQDFDAVSLYPAAMARLYLVKGKPAVIPPELLQYEALVSKSTAFVVDINITHVGRHLHFPLIVKQDASGNHNVNECVRMRVDDIMLADLIERQDMRFDIIRGYYWTGQKDYTIQSFIQHVFDMRNEYKRQHNPLQLVYKLIMNSAYGKTIQRPIDTKTKFYNLYNAEQERLFKNYVIKNYQQLIDVIEVDGSKIRKVVLRKTTNNQFGLNLFGIHVLSMSKRIMNGVFGCCEDIGGAAVPYYQDTDSLHIAVDALPQVAELFSKRYDRQLIGSKLGQFHSDFTSNDGRSDIEHARRSIFIAKKVYIDELVASDGSIRIMSRMKGVSLGAVEVEAQKQGMSLFELYDDLYNGRQHTFDLTLSGPSFDMRPTFTIKSRAKFTRRIGIGSSPPTS
jgi:hypothetical protein